MTAEGNTIRESAGITEDTLEAAAALKSRLAATVAEVRRAHDEAIEQRARAETAEAERDEARRERDKYLQESLWDQGWKERAECAEAVVAAQREALQAAVGVLVALPKSALSKRRAQVLAQCRAALRLDAEEVNEPGLGGVEGSVGQSAEATEGSIGDPGQEVGLASPGSLTSPVDTAPRRLRKWGPWGWISEAAPEEPT